MTLRRGVLWLHLLAMAFFVGGQLMLAAVLVPVMGLRIADRSGRRRVDLGSAPSSRSRT